MKLQDSKGPKCKFCQRYFVLEPYEITRFQRVINNIFVDKCVLEPYEITRFQREDWIVANEEQVLEPYEITRFQR